MSSLLRRPRSPLRPPSVASLWRAELQRGAELLRAGDSTGAHASFARAHALAPKEAEPAFALGRLEWRRGRTAEAERLLRLAYGMRYDWPLAAAALSRVLIDRGALKEAKKILAAARQRDARHPALLVVSGEWALAADRFAEARTLFIAAENEGAAPMVTRAGLSRAENARGLVLAKRGRRTEAAFALKRASDLDPSWAGPLINLGTVLHRLGQREAARTRYQDALRIEPTHPTAHFNLGLLERELGELTLAAASFARALAATPPHPKARRELALTLVGLGNSPAQPISFDEESRGRGAEHAATFANLGLASLRAGQRMRAEMAFRRALELAPHHRAAARELTALLDAEAARNPSPGGRRQTVSGGKGTRVLVRRPRVHEPPPAAPPRCVFECRLWQAAGLCRRRGTLAPVCDHPDGEAGLTALFTDILEAARKDERERVHQLFTTTIMSDEDFSALFGPRAKALRPHYLSRSWVDRERRAAELVAQVYERKYDTVEVLPI